ncbi:hypothetical protein pEaSNUABM29_00225 [Erwinia phage pEa_SNUABM_29]|nr:hypothetical protein pEaSNUABM29_00225 [Erwinia phage pEa_SNUABM_29]
MLKVEVPALLNITPQLFEALFYRHWEGYLQGVLKNNPQWYPLEDEFKYTSINTCIEVFTAWLQEMYDCLNTSRVFTLEHVEVNVTDVYEGYAYEEGICATGLSQQDVEEQVFHYIEWFTEKLMQEDFVNQVESVLITVHEDLRVIKQNYRLLGYWYDTYATSSTLWQSSSVAFGIQDGDFEALYYGPWQYGFGTKFHEQTDMMTLEFYLCHGLFYTDNCVSQIPNGELTTMCRINDDVAKRLNNY